MKRLGALLIGVLALAACDDDDPDGDDVEPGPDAVVSRDFALRIENVAPWTVLKTGATYQKTNNRIGPAGPREAFEIRFSAGKGHSLSLATMLVESNDWFFAFGPDGLPLYDGDTPRSGDITHFVRLWDAGTEADQEPGVGDATGANQPSRDFGEPDPDTNVREVPVTARLTDNSTFVRPAISSMIRVTLTPEPDQMFLLRIVNRSNADTLQTSAGPMSIRFSQIVWAVHRTPAPLFEENERARENGLESLVESGDPYPLSSSLGFSRGAATPLSPGVFVVHEGPAPLYSLGTVDAGLGLEALAEDGNPIPLRDALAARPEVSGVFDTPIGADAPGPAMPGQAFEVTFRGEPGDFVSFATMFGMANDWFFASVPDGIPLFAGDIPRSCDVTSEVRLLDLGTETDQELDVGVDTAPQQVAPGSGRADNVTEVREVTIERYGEPEVLHVRVMLTPL
jgi:hypothetical protein